MGDVPERGADSRVDEFARKRCDDQPTCRGARALAGSTGVVTEGRGEGGCSRTVDACFSHNCQKRSVENIRGRGAVGWVGS